VLPEYALFKSKIQTEGHLDWACAPSKKLPAIAVLDEALSTVITTEMAILN